MANSQSNDKAIDPPEVITVEGSNVACDGGEEALGHPRVYLTMSDNGEVECPYCDRLFKGQPGGGSAH